MWSSISFQKHDNLGHYVPKNDTFLGWNWSFSFDWYCIKFLGVFARFWNSLQYISCLFLVSQLTSHGHAEFSSWYILSSEERECPRWFFNKSCFENSILCSKLHPRYICPAFLITWVWRFSSVKRGLFSLCSHTIYICSLYLD